jgi:hypothetical protein
LSCVEYHHLSGVNLVSLTHPMYANELDAIITEIIAAAANMLNAFFILLFLLLYIPGVHAPFRLKPSLF